jgi:hypothetical protein
MVSAFFRSLPLAMQMDDKPSYFFSSAHKLSPAKFKKNVDGYVVTNRILGKIHNFVASE